MTSGTIFNEIIVWDMDGKVIKRLVGHDGICFSLQWAPSHDTLVSGADDRV